VKEFSSQLIQQSQRVGQLEVEMRQLQAPRSDRRATRDDSVENNVATPIDAEFSEAPLDAQQDLGDVQPNLAAQP
jgi:hypothetical protein